MFLLYSLAPFHTNAMHHTYRGGMEVLFSYKRSHEVSLPCEDDGKKPTIKYLIKWLLDNLLSDQTRPELFAQGDTV